MRTDVPLPRGAMLRRGFLRRAAAAAAMLTGPLAVPSSVLGQGRPSPSNRITMGFIGLGGQGGGHLFGGGTTYLVGGYLGRDQVQVLGVCDVWRHKREAARQRVNHYYAEQWATGATRLAWLTTTSATCSPAATLTPCSSPRPIIGTP